MSNTTGKVTEQKPLTAMQHLFEMVGNIEDMYIKTSKTKDASRDFKKGVDAILTAMAGLKMNREQLIEKEKKQITGAFVSAITLNMSDETMHDEAEEYYVNTFHQPKTKQ